MYMGILPACDVYTCMPGPGDEEGVGFSGTGDEDGYGLPCGCWESNLGTLEEQPML